MSVRMRTTLGRVLDDLGPTVLEHLAGPADPERPVDGVVIHDPLDPPSATESTVVLGVGLQKPSDIVDVMLEGRFTALVVRLPLLVDERLQAAADRSNTVVLGLARGASWAQLASLLGSLLAVDDVGGDRTETLAGAPAGDLFTLANAVAALLDAPVTIEDRSSRVLAFSGGQDAADQSRIETVLGRQVPERYRRFLEEHGVFRDLYSSDRPIHITDIEGTQMDRAAVRIRAGDEILGSMWAAVDQPLSEERMLAFADASKLVALHMLRARAGADVERRLRSELVATALEGGQNAGAAACRLGVNVGPVCVMAMAMRTPPDNAIVPQAEAELQRVGAALALHLTAIHPRSAAAPVGGIHYGIMPISRASAEGPLRPLHVAGQFLSRIGQRPDVVIGVGTVAADFTGLARSRHDADRALRVLRDGVREMAAASIDDVRVDSMLLELRDLLAADGLQATGSLARLLDYDRKHHAEMLATLRAWLDAFGDVNRAAAAVHVHPNTFRYRMRRLAEISGIDLDDPDARFGAMLQLRLLEPRRSLVAEAAAADEGP